MMYLALTYDHRLLDGREAVTFLVKIKVSSPHVETDSTDVFAGIHRRPQEDAACLSVSLPAMMPGGGEISRIYGVRKSQADMQKV